MNMTKEVLIQIYQNLLQNNISNVKVLLDEEMVFAKSCFFGDANVVVKDKNDLLNFICFVTNPYFSLDNSYIGFSDIPPYYCSSISIEFLCTESNINEVIRYLVDNKNIPLDYLDEAFGQTALGTAIGFDSTQAALVLINLMLERDQKHLLNAFNTGGYVSKANSSNPLLLSIQKANDAVFSALLNTGKIEVNMADRFGLTPLHWAIIMGLPEMTRDLLRMGANPEALSVSGKKPIDYLTINAEMIKDPEFRQVRAHFMDDHEFFLAERAKKMVQNTPALIELLMQARPDSDMNTQKLTS